MFKVIVECLDLSQNQAVLEFCEKNGIMAYDKPTTEKQKQKTKLKRIKAELKIADENLRGTRKTQEAILKKISFLETRCKAVKNQYRILLNKSRLLR